MDCTFILRSAMKLLYRYMPQFLIVSILLLWRMVSQTGKRVAEFLHGIEHAPLLRCAVHIDRPGDMDESFNICKLLLENGVNCDERDNCNYTPFLYAVKCGNLKVLQLLLDHGADITAVTDDSRTSLHLAVKHSNTAMIEFLLNKRSIDIQCSDRKGYLALHLAVKYGRLRECKLLLKFGADITALDGNDKTMLHTVVEYFNPKVMELLLAMKVIDIQCSDRRGYSALHLAAKFGKLQGCELLLRFGAMVDQPSRCSRHTPLSLVISDESHDVMIMAQTVQVLLDYGADVVHKVRRVSVLRRAANVETSDFDVIKKTLIQHLARMEYLDLIINEDDRHTIESNECHAKHYQLCKEELEKMRETRFYNNVSVFNLFIENGKVIAGFAWNPELAKALTESDFDDQFPIYFASVRKKFYAEVEKQKSRNTAAIVLSGLFKFDDPSHNVIQKFFNYLVDDDVKILTM